MDKKDFLALPIEERRKLLKEMADDPEIQAYYRQLFPDEPKPDEGRLLTDEEIETTKSEFCSYLAGHRKSLREVAKAQDAKTASIKDAECFFKMDRAEHGAYNAGREDMKAEQTARIEALISKLEGLYRADDTIGTTGRLWRYIQALKATQRQDFVSTQQASVPKAAPKATHCKGDEG